MATKQKNELRDLMKMAWQFIKRNGYTKSEALRVAWLNFKLKSALYKGIVKFYYQKVDGTIREAYGTLKAGLVPPTQGARKENPTIQVYYDSEKMAWRCFKIANLNKIAL